jgi:hypothetical protein
MTHEYVLSLEQTTDPDSSAPCLRVHVRTVREFASFGYGIGLSVGRTNTGLIVEIGGLELPRMTMQQSGPAVATANVAVPSDGTHSLTVRRKDASAEFSFVIENGRLQQPASPLTGEFVSVEAHG